MAQASEKKKDPSLIVTEADRIEDKAQNILVEKIGWMAHAPHPHSLFDRFLHYFNSHDDHHHHHTETYLDKNPYFYNVRIP